MRIDVPLGDLLCILSNRSDFRGTVPIFGSKFTAVPLFSLFSPAFLVIFLCTDVPINYLIFPNFIEFLRFWTKNHRDFVLLLVLDRLVGMGLLWLYIQSKHCMELFMLQAAECTSMCSRDSLIPSPAFLRKTLKAGRGWGQGYSRELYSLNTFV